LAKILKLIINILKLFGLPHRSPVLFYPVLNNSLRTFFDKQFNKQITPLSHSIDKKLPFKINYYTDMSVHSSGGTGTGSNQLARVLINLNIPIHNCFVQTHASIPTNLTQKASSFDGIINIFHINLRQLIYFYHLIGRKTFQNHYNIAYVYWELESLPKLWNNIFLLLDEIWTPSEFSRRAIASQSTIPVFTIPPVIESLQHDSERRRFDLPDDKFIFLFTFDFQSYFDRKNSTAVVAAFCKAFGNNSNLLLVIKCANSARYPIEKKALLRAVRQTNIRVLDTTYSHEESKRLINVCDCYTSLHRAEGFGFTIAEAMAAKKPVIVTGYSGNMDFTHDDNAYLVKYKLVPLKKNIGPYPEGFLWADPDLRHAAELMRFVYDHYDKAKEKASYGAKFIETYYNSSRVGMLIKERLNAIYQSIQP